MSGLGKRRAPIERAGRRRRESSRGSSEGILTVERQAHDGRGVARDAAGKTVFIDRALPGEQLMAAVHIQHRRFDEAHIRTLIATSAERVTPACVHFGQCGGCDLQHQALAAQRRHRQQVLWEQFAHHDLTLPTLELLIADEAEHPGYGYRRRARLGVRLDSTGRLYFGFRRRGQEALFNVEQCPILDPGLEALLPVLRQQLTQLEAPRRVGHVELIRLEQQTCLVVRQLREVPEDMARWQSLAEQQGLALVMALGRERIDHRRLDNGEPLHYHLPSPAVGHAELKIEVRPGDFLQSNAAVNRALVRTVIEWSAVQPGARVFDLFAGVGNFTLPLAACGVQVTALEGRAQMVERLRHNAAINQLMPSVNAMVADLNDSDMALSGLAQANVVILDPPRAGALMLCRRLVEARPERIIHVSCDPATLARDTRTLVEGGYRIERAAVVDMFPQTAHQESIVLLRRGD